MLNYYNTGSYGYPDGRPKRMKALQYILITGIILFAFDILKAEEISPDETAIELEKIIVTNRRATGTLGEAVGNIIIISAEQIEKLPARNLSEVLNYVPGVDIQPRQGFGRPTPHISIQGSDSRHVRVMVDGIPLNLQSSGQVDPVEFPIENIARIEVIKGPASSTWGSSLGGVINVITKDTGDTLIPKGSITASFAEFRTKKESFDLSGKASEIGYYIFSSYMYSGGKGPRDNVLEKKAFGKLSYDLKDKGRLIATYGYSGADVNSGRLPDGTWEAQPYRQRYGKLGWEKDFGGAGLRVDFKHSRNDVVTKSFNSVDNDDDLAFRTEAKNMLYQLSINSNFRLRERDLLVLGADFDNDILKFPSYLSRAKSVKLYAPYANYTLKIDPWDINLGLRYDWNTEFGGDLSPSWGAVYHFKNMPDTLIRAEVSHAFNAPPLLWKFNSNPALYTAANPDLKPERAWVYETGLESRVLPGLWCNLSLYRSDVRDAINNALNAEGEVYKKNFQKFRRQGAEFQCKVKLCDGLSFTGRAAFNDIEDRSTKQTVRGGGKPRQSFDAALEYKNKRGFTASLTGYYNRWNEPASSEPNDRKMLCDLRISQAWKHFTPFLNVYNLTNSSYWADYYYPVPERYFEGGFSFKW